MSGEEGKGEEEKAESPPLFNNAKGDETRAAEWGDPHQLPSMPSAPSAPPIKRFRSLGRRGGGLAMALALLGMNCGLGLDAPAIPERTPLEKAVDRVAEAWPHKAEDIYAVVRAEMKTGFRFGGRTEAELLVEVQALLDVLVERARHARGALEDVLISRGEASAGEFSRGDYLQMCVEAVRTTGRPLDDVRLAHMDAQPSSSGRRAQLLIIDDLTEASPAEEIRRAMADRRIHSGMMEGMRAELLTVGAASTEPTGRLRSARLGDIDLAQHMESITWAGEPGIGMGRSRSGEDNCAPLPIGRMAGSYASGSISFTATAGGPPLRRSGCRRGGEDRRADPVRKGRRKAAKAARKKNRGK